MRAAIQFLTVVPTRSQQGFGAAWFPVVGCLLGLLAAAALRLPQGAICALVVLATLTGGLHEDGLADVCDAVRAYRSRENMIEILHDSRIGAHGALALVFSVLLRWQALDHMIGDAWLRVPIVVGLARASMVLLAAWSPSATAGVGQHFRGSLSSVTIASVLVQSSMLVALGSWVLLPVQAALLLATRQWFQTRLGGVTGDCLGFQCQLSEALSLLVFTWV
jgi:adenosylcobinamide-GDP ribazoletransferase